MRKGFYFQNEQKNVEHYFAHVKAIWRNPHNSSNWITTLLGSWVTNTPSCQNFVSRKKSFSLHFRKNITWLSVGLWMNCQGFFSVSCKPAYLWVSTNWCFVNNLHSYARLKYGFHVRDSLNCPTVSPDCFCNATSVIAQFDLFGTQDNGLHCENIAGQRI